MLIILGSIPVSKVLTTFFHELGHGLTGLLFSSKSVTLYLGSFGATPESKRLRIGRLIVVFQLNIFKWDNGLCELEEQISSRLKIILHVAAGPVFPFAIALVMSSSFLLLELHWALILFSLVFVNYTLISCIRNLTPGKKEVQLLDGRTTKGDGATIRLTLQLKGHTRKFEAASELYYQKNMQKLLMHLKN